MLAFHRGNQAGRRPGHVSMWSVLFIVLAVWTVFAIGFAVAMLMVMSKRMDEQTAEELHRVMLKEPGHKPLDAHYPPAKVPDAIRKYAKKLDSKPTKEGKKP